MMGLNSEGKRKAKIAAIEAMNAHFTFADIQAAMVRAVGPNDDIYRLADRLLQSERKAGRIRVTADDKRIWEKVK